jgi:acyl carrier protein
MTNEEILQRLRQVMKRTSQQKTDWDAVNESSAIAGLGFDSLAVLDLIYDVQQEFAVEFDAEEMTRVKTIGDLIAFLKAKGA